MVAEEGVAGPLVQFFDLRVVTQEKVSVQPGAEAQSALEGRVRTAVDVCLEQGETLQEVLSIV